MLVQGHQPQPFRTVLACVDFSETSREAVAQALRVGAQDQSQVCFLHVFHGPWHRLHYRAATSEASPVRVFTSTAASAPAQVEHASISKNHEPKPTGVSV